MSLSPTTNRTSSPYGIPVTRNRFEIMPSPIESSTAYSTAKAIPDEPDPNTPLAPAEPLKKIVNSLKEPLQAGLTSIQNILTNVLHTFRESGTRLTQNPNATTVKILIAGCASIAGLFGLRNLVDGTKQVLGKNSNETIPGPIYIALGLLETLAASSCLAPLLGLRGPMGAAALNLQTCAGLALVAIGGELCLGISQGTNWIARLPFIGPILQDIFKAPM